MCFANFSILLMLYFLISSVLIMGLPRYAHLYPTNAMQVVQTCSAVCFSPQCSQSGSGSRPIRNLRRLKFACPVAICVNILVSFLVCERIDFFHLCLILGKTEIYVK